MSDVVVSAVGQDATAGGEQAGKQFSQQDLERIIAERLSQQKRQFADYDELKAKAAKLAEMEEAQKSEEQKLQERLAKAEQERTAALALANERLIKGAFMAEAAKAGALHPADVFALADRAQVSVDEQGNVLGVEAAVAAIVGAGRIPLATANRPQAPKLDGGAGGGTREAEKDAPLTDEELTIAKRLNIAPEAYAARKRETEKLRQA